MSRPSSRNSRIVYGMPGSCVVDGGGGSNIPETAQSFSGVGKTTGATSRKPKLTIPSFNVSPIDPLLEIRKRTRCNNPSEGEDLDGIKEIVGDLHAEAVTVQEFVGLISSYTSDHGDILRKVMNDDLSAFRRMATRVYDTMTQDVSDVLANEQMNLNDYYNEKYSLYTENMMHTIDEIYQYAPNFDFELYYEDAKEYLNRLFPLDPEPDAENNETQRRQETFYKLHWLRSEGERLREENDKLLTRLKELTKQQQDELANVRKREEMAEIRKCHLEATQTELENQLKELGESVEKSLAFQEQNIRLEEQNEEVPNSRKPSNQQVQNNRAKTPVRPPSEPWNLKTMKASEDENQAQSVTSAESLIASSSKSAEKKKKPIKSKIKCNKKPPDGRHPPVSNTPCAKAHSAPKEREVIPLHYSPKAPQPRILSPRRMVRGGSPVIDLPIEQLYSEQASHNRNKGIRMNKDVWGRS